MTPNTTTSSIDDLGLAYWVWRPAIASDNYLLLIHGGASNHTRWSEFVEHTQLTASWTIVSPDMRGNGATMTRGLILIDPEFQSALRGRQRLLRRYSWLVKALTRTVRVLNSLGLRRRHIKGRDLRELDAETRLAIQGEESFEEIARRYGALGPILRHTPTANYLCQAIETSNPLPSLSDIDLPVLVLLSGGTTLANLDRNREEVARFPDSEIPTLDANHWPLTETPEAVRGAIDQWLLRRFEETTISRRREPTGS